MDGAVSAGNPILYPALAFLIGLSGARIYSAASVVASGSLNLTRKNDCGIAGVCWQSRAFSHE